MTTRSTDGAVIPDMGDVILDMGVQSLIELRPPPSPSHCGRLGHMSCRRGQPGGPPTHAARSPAV